MSDTKLRDLERRWKETGSVQDEAAYLLERMRAGDLSRERLDLAAYCGHEGARQAIGDASPPPLVGGTPESSERSVYEWAHGLARFGKEVLVRAALAGALRIRDAWDNTYDRTPWRDQAASAYNAAQAWLNCPCSAHADNVRQVIAPASRLVLRRTTESPDPWLLFAAPAVDAARCVVDDAANEAGACYRAVSRAAKVLAHQGGRDHQTDFALENAEVLATVSRSLVEWALRSSA